MPGNILPHFPYNNRFGSGLSHTLKILKWQACWCHFETKAIQIKAIKESKFDLLQWPHVGISPTPQLDIEEMAASWRIIIIDMIIIQHAILYGKSTRSFCRILDPTRENTIKTIYLSPGTYTMVLIILWRHKHKGWIPR